MNTNEYNLIINKFASFDEPFCQKKYNKSDKCVKYYINETKNGLFHSSVCPYGYTCIFGKNKIVSSIICENNSDISLILKRYRYNIRSHNKVNPPTIIKKDEYDRIYGETKLSYEIDEYRNAFHDLKNNNRYLLDNIGVVEKYIDDDFMKLIEDLSNVFVTHNEKLNTLINEFDKYIVYVNELKCIENIVTSMLNFENINDEKLKKVKSNLDFIDFRIRYLKRLVDQTIDYHDKQNLRKLQIIKILTKLRYAFEIPTKKKEQRIKMNIQSEDDYTINAYDDIYVAFFILFENATKYAPFNSTIDVTYEYKNNEIFIKFENQSEDVGNVSLLTFRGFQGKNSKNGSGLGLAVAKEIFNSSGFDLSVIYDGGKFCCIVKKFFNSN